MHNSKLNNNKFYAFFTMALQVQLREKLYKGPLSIQYCNIIQFLACLKKPASHVQMWTFENKKIVAKAVYCSEVKIIPTQLERTYINFNILTIALKKTNGKNENYSMFFETTEK